MPPSAGVTIRPSASLPKRRRSDFQSPGAVPALLSAAERSAPARQNSACPPPRSSPWRPKQDQTRLCIAAASCVGLGTNGSCGFPVVFALAQGGWPPAARSWPVMVGRLRCWRQHFLRNVGRWLGRRLLCRCLLLNVRARHLDLLRPEVRIERVAVSLATNLHRSPARTGRHHPPPSR